MGLTDAQWGDMSDGYPPYQPCHGYFQEWSRDGILKLILHALVEDLYQRGDRHQRSIYRWHLRRGQEGLRHVQ